MNKAKEITFEEELGQIITNTDMDLDCSYLRLLTIQAVREIHGVIGKHTESIPRETGQTVPLKTAESVH